MSGDVKPEGDTLPGTAGAASRRAALGGLAAMALAACQKPSLEGGQQSVAFALPGEASRGSFAPAWRPVMADMQRATGLKVSTFVPQTDADLVLAMNAGRVDAAWASNQAALAAVSGGASEVFARTLGPDGGQGYRSVLVTGAKNAIALPKLLKCDHTLTYGQAGAGSAAGRLAPIAFLFGPAGVDPAKCFKAVRTADFADNLAAVAKGDLDVAALHSTFLALSRQVGRPDAEKVKVVWASPTLPQDPILWRRDLDPDVKERLREFFFTYARGDTPEAARQREALAKLDIGGFEPADDNHLLMAREIAARLAFAAAEQSGDATRAATAKQAALDAMAAREAFEGRVRTLGSAE
jgi:phosphonate transport system substrate-binding protein